jgi:hypothetical protein
MASVQILQARGFMSQVHAGGSFEGADEDSLVRLREQFEHFQGIWEQWQNREQQEAEMRAREEEERKRRLKAKLTYAGAVTRLAARIRRASAAPRHADATTSVSCDDQQEGQACSEMPETKRVPSVGHLKRLGSSKYCALGTGDTDGERESVNMDMDELPVVE